MLKWLKIALVPAVIGASFPVSAFAVGAIAVDDAVGISPSNVGYGYVVGRSDRHEAERGAIHECRRHGNDSCKVVVWFETCGAYAASRNHAGIGYGSSQRRAEEKALDDCGTEHCRLVVSACE